MKHLIAAAVCAAVLVSANAKWTEVRQDDFLRDDNIEGDLLAISFLDEKRGWAAGINGLILSTNDGGETWTKQEMPAPPESVPPRFRRRLASPMLSVALTFDKKRILLAGTGSVLSNDGGKTWEFTNVGTRNRIIAGAVVSDKTLFLAGDNSSLTRTENAAGSWKLISDGGFTRVGESRTSYEAVAFADKQNGWIVGTGGLVLSSTDEGATWNKPDIQVNVVENLYDIRFVSPKTGWIVGQEATILRTTDAGAAWERIANDAQKDDFYYDLRSVAFSTKNPKLGWIVGDNGKTLVTEDGGATWPFADTGVTHKLYAVAAHPSGSAFAVGEWGIVLKYTPEDLEPKTE